ncbi:MAG TPA: IclR family transcriptional regulator [Actinoallomurus sp.]
MGEPAAPTLIGSVRRALHLLDAVCASPRPATAKRLAHTLRLPLPTVYHLLRTLVYEGYLRKLDDGYVLGGRADGLRQGNARQAAVGRARPVLSHLRDEMKAAAYLSSYEDGEIVLVDVADGPGMRCADLWVGMRDAAHATAFGKCILSCLDKAGRDDYLSRHELADLTPRTVTDRHVLERTLSAGHAYLVDREEYLLGTACVAAPVRAPGFLGAIAISVPARRFASSVADADRLGRVASRVARAVSAPITI